jgi:predicted Na+-dependent transporter
MVKWTPAFLQGYFFLSAFARRSFSVGEPYFKRASAGEGIIFTLEVGMQNAGLASALAKSMGKVATTGLASVIFGTMMNVTGSSLASWWHNRNPKDKPADE